MEGALGAGFVAGEAGEGVRGVGTEAVVVKGVGVVVRGDQARFVLKATFEVLTPLVVEARFHYGAAAEAPGGEGELIDELSLGGG